MHSAFTPDKKKRRGKRKQRDQRRRIAQYASGHSVSRKVAARKLGIAPKKPKGPSHPRRAARRANERRALERAEHNAAVHARDRAAADAVKRSIASRAARDRRRPSEAAAPEASG